MFGLTGCNFIPRLRPDRTQFYALTAPSDPARAAATDAPRVLVRRIDLPAYLRGKPMIVRRDGTEIDAASLSWWSESPDLAIGRVIRERLNGQGIQAVDRTDGGYDLEAVVTVRRFEGESDDNGSRARFAANFELRRAAGGPPAARGNFSPEPTAWDGRNYAELAEALSTEVAGLADAIRAAIPERF